MSTFNSIPAAERIIVALDCDVDRALEIAQSLKGKASWLKVGMTLYYDQGPSIVKIFKDMGFKVFLDLKFFDIPHQVKGAAASACMSGADMITMHALGGSDMMKAAVEGIEELHLESNPITLAVTVLTSMDQDDLSEIGVSRQVVDQVQALALLAQSSGVSGVVASPQEAPLLREKLGPDAYIVTPGVRPLGSSKGDQSRVTTPEQAFKNGASHIVIGRPITEQDNPGEAFEAIAKGL